MGGGGSPDPPGNGMKSILNSTSHKRGLISIQKKAMPAGNSGRTLKLKITVHREWSGEHRALVLIQTHHLQEKLQSSVFVAPAREKTKYLRVLGGRFVLS